MFTPVQTKRCLGFAAAVYLLTNITPALAVGELPKIPSESVLIETLKTKPNPEKAIACKQLAIVGTKECVPELAKLLADKDLSSWSRIALEAINDPSADDALILGASDLSGRIQIGAINSIGVRKSEKATKVLTELLAAENKQAASAAAVALGKIGNEAATKTLREALTSSKGPVLSAVAEGCILCAEQLNKDGKSDEAAKIYDEVRKADVPKQRKLEATRGYIIARGDAGVPTLIKQLHSPDKAFFQIGLTTARQIPGRQLTEALSAELPKLKSDRAIGLLSVLADRTDGGLPPAVLNAAKSGDKQLRIAAISALGRLGDASNVPMLLEIAAESDADISQAAAQALATVPGDNVNSELVASLSKADGKALAALIHAVGQKRIEATPALLKTLSNSDTQIRQASFAALGETVKPKDLHVLVGQYVSGNNAADSEVAGKALKAACIRMPDREACATELAAAMPKASSDANVYLVEILSAMGGPKALETIGAAAKGSDQKVQDTATKALGKWMTADAEPVLLELASADSGCKYPDRALRGYIRIARQFSIPDAKRAEICDKALEVAKRNDDKKLALEALERHPSKDGLKIAVKASKLPGLTDDARRALLVIAQKVIKDREELRGSLAAAGVTPVKLEIVKAHYGSGKTQRDVTDVLQKDVGEFPVVNLHAATYNKTFGGDPAPGSEKKLVVEYRIDGKNGSVTLPENAVIMLPMPK